MAVSGLLTGTVEASGLATVIATGSMIGTGVDSTGVLVSMFGMTVLSSFSFVGMARKDGLGIGCGTSVGWGRFGIVCHWKIWAGDLSRSNLVIKE